MLNHYVLTLDTDWAPDFIIEDVARQLTEKSIRATWFVTHDSPAIRSLQKNKLFEVGIHPNFLKTSTQGELEEDVLRHVKAIAPKATSMRTHSLVQSNQIMGLAAEKFGIKTDVSLLLPETPNLQPHRIFYYDNKGLVRIPYFWQDDREMYNPKQAWDLTHPKYHVSGLKVFDFHPFHIYLNTETMQRYKKLKALGPLTEVTPKQVSGLINTKTTATKNLFSQFITELQKQKNTFTISEITKEWSDAQ